MVDSYRAKKITVDINELANLADNTDMARDIDKREIDFVILRDKNPIFAVECKSGEKRPSPHLRYFKQRTNIPQFYQVHLGEKDYSPEEGIRVLPFLTWVRELGLP